MSKFQIDRRRLLLAGSGLAVAAIAACDPRPGPNRNRLVVWQTEADANAGTVLERITQELEAQHQGLSIEVETINWNALSERMTNAVSSGSVPDLAHIQPFMLTALQTQGHLLPLTDVAREIGFPANSYACLQTLGERQGEQYGLPYAVGTTFWSYRADIFRRLGIAPPRTWAETLASIRTVRRRGTQAERELLVLLPGASPFFMDQLFAELVANNDGRLFNPTTGEPDLNNPAVQEVIRFFIDLKATGALDPNWVSQTYQDQFVRFPNGEALMAPVTYARAAVAITKRRDELVADGRPLAGIPCTPEQIGALDQPAGPRRRGGPVATMDAEVFVLFDAAESRRRADRAKDFLRAFYTDANYLEFISQVPIHLTPIKRELRNAPQYEGAAIVQAWVPWQEHTNRYLDGEPGHQVRPILMPGADDRSLQYLFQFANAKILSAAVERALTEDPGANPDGLAAEIAQSAQCSAVSLLARLGANLSAPTTRGCNA